MSAIAADAVPPQPPKVTYGDVLKHPEVKILAISRAGYKMAGSTLSYGSMVYLAQIGSSQIEISAVSASQYLAALIFGMQGGALADSMSKRLAMFAGFATQATLCALVIIFTNTQFAALFLLMFLTSMFNQVISPSLKSTVAIVSSPAELATCAVLVNLIGSIASAIGSGFIAPILMKRTDINVVVAVAGVLYLVAAIRIYRLPASEAAHSVREAAQSVNWKPQALSIKFNASWVYAHRPVASMMLIGGMCGAMFEGFNSLIPLYVADVLGENPANAIYIFAPAAIGYIVGAIYGPALMRHFGERRLAIIALFCMIAGLVLFGAIDLVAPFFAAINPLRLLTIFGITFSSLVLAAGMIAIPANFGSTASGESVQTYINRNVPVEQQGGIFGLSSVQNNALNLFTIMGLGVLAAIVGPQLVFLFAPILIGAVMFWFLRYSYVGAGAAAPTKVERRAFFTEDPAALGETSDATELEHEETAEPPEEAR